MSKTPKHVAIIMDGNGRWARQRMLPRTVGHAKGAAGVRSLVKACTERGVQCLTLFAFSTENWKRPQEEVSTLMGLFIQYLEGEVRSMSEAGVRLKVVGDVQGFPPELRERIHSAQQLTAGNDRLTLVVAANYGGRWDVVQAARACLAGSVRGAAGGGEDLHGITEDGLEAHLSTSGLPPLDLLIRTGGERRLSNFLLWQAAYAELYFCDTLWPDFGVGHLDEALQWFGERERRFGDVAPEKVDPTRP